MAMKSAARFLTLTVFAVVTILVLLYLAAPEKPHRFKAPTPQTTPDQSAASPVDTGPAGRDATGKYYFDVSNHSAEEFRALLERAYAIYEQTPPAARAALEVIMVRHGPDIAYFANHNYAEHQDIVDLAAKLDAFGVFDFKVCTVAANRLGIDAEQVPPFIEFVPYGPGELERLREAGFVRL